MLKADAPPKGWYPDPENRSRLRWWDGLDWTDITRAYPQGSELDEAEEHARLAALAEERATAHMPSVPQGMSRQDTQQLIADVRTAARDEVDRAAELFTQRTQAAMRQVTPLITSYTSTLLRWVRWAVIIAIVLLVAWFVFQVVVQASFFEWIGDRIDNLTNDEENGLAGTAVQVLSG